MFTCECREGECLHPDSPQCEARFEEEEVIPVIQQQNVTQIVLQQQQQQCTPMKKTDPLQKEGEIFEGDDDFILSF